MKVSVILPAKNEGAVVGQVVSRIFKVMPKAEVIVVNDGSTDDTKIKSEASGAKVITHPYSKGNGAAIKSGARAATGDILIFMDSDGQHRPEDIPRLLNRLSEGYDMVVGARSSESQANMGRWAANTFYNKLSSWMVGQKIEDLTSGYRVVDAVKFKEFLHILPNAFSYPTTSTMAFFRAGYSVAYEPIVADERVGESHIRILKDGIRFLIIIFKIGTLYSPLKLFGPISLGFFALGFGHYINTLISDGRFTNMSALLLSVSVIIFLVGLVSEQITQLLYKNE
ncbi:MAG: glycosyltransferase involved in cell wall biosynthesis [Patiriisocius sp.]|jgi:glycosyltransferase involved in cell wall biosynthesis